MQRLERFNGSEWERVNGRGQHPAPSQVEAENTADATGKLFSWNILRLNQWLAVHFPNLAALLRITAIAEGPLLLDGVEIATIEDVADEATAWWGTITGADIRSKLGVATLSGSNTGDQDLTTLLTKAADLYTTQTGSFTLAADMHAKNVPVSGVATLTIPAVTGFPAGYQASFISITPTEVDITLSGTIKARGTKCAQYGRFTIALIDGAFVATGGLRV